MALISPILAEDGAGSGSDLGGADWGSTPLGAQEDWPAALRFAFNVCDHSALPTAILWGAERLLVHNPAWQALTGGRVLNGRPAEEIGGGVWTVLESLAVQVEESGKGAFLREQPLLLTAEAGPQEAWWSFSLLPILDEAGLHSGVLVQANDVTKTMLVERRLSFQIRLADRLRGLTDPEAVKQAATALLGVYLGAARVGYAEVDEAGGNVRVLSDWTRDEGVESLAGHATLVATIGAEALAFLKSGEVLALPDIRAFAAGGASNVAAWEEMGICALITVPLVRDGELKALLYVHEPQPRAWSRSDAAMARDVAERTWAAVERAQAEQSLRDSEDHYRHTVELNPQVAWTATPDGALNRVAGRWEEWTGGSGLGTSWAEGLHPDDRAHSFAVWARSTETGEPYDVEHRVKMRSGGYRWARSRAFPRRDADGAICLWYGSTEDIHEQKVAEERQQLLINELNHRVKNTLATVQAIAFQTLKGDLPLAEARGRFEARLMALSRAHNLLTDGNWGGAPLAGVVADSTEHLSGERGAFEAEGESLWLNPRAALALALAFHELGTNAAKYGALSKDGGKVAIRWSAEGNLLRLEWKERDGPPVEPPGGRGFGSRLIERGLEADLGGTAKLHFEPDGLRCTIEAALDAVLGREPGSD